MYDVYKINTIYCALLLKQTYTYKESINAPWRDALSISKMSQTSPPPQLSPKGGLLSFGSSLDSTLPGNTMNCCSPGLLETGKGVGDEKM